MSKESQLTDERRKLIRPEAFEPESRWNENALHLVSTLRKAIVKGGRLDLDIYLDVPPYFTYRSFEFPFIVLDIAYVKQRDESVILHRDRLTIYYFTKEVNRWDEFVAALKNKKISRITCMADMDSETTDRSFISIDPSGYIILTGIKIPNWEES